MTSSTINHRFLHINKKTSNDTTFLVSGRGTLTHKQSAKRSFGCFELDPPAIYMGEQARATSAFNAPKQLITLRNRSLLPCSVDMVPNKNPSVRAAFKSGNEYNKRKVAPGMTISIEVSVKAHGLKKGNDRAHRGGNDTRHETPSDKHGHLEEEIDDGDDDGYSVNRKAELLDTICVRAGRQVFAVPIYAGSAPTELPEENNESIACNTEAMKNSDRRKDQPETQSSIGAVVEVHQVPHMPGTLWNTQESKLEWRSDRVRIQLHPQLEFREAIREEEERHQQCTKTMFPRHLLDVEDARMKMESNDRKGERNKKKRFADQRKKVVRLHPDVLRVLRLKEEREQARRDAEVAMGGAMSFSQPKKKASGGHRLRWKLDGPLAPVRTARNMID
jgi:hypothetical protein